MSEQGPPEHPTPEHPTPEMIAAGVHMHQTPRTGPPETLVHDIWQSMYDAQPEVPPAADNSTCLKYDAEGRPYCGHWYPESCMCTACPRRLATSAASDLRERAKALITKLQNGEPCDPNDDDIEPIAAEFAAIRAEAKTAEQERCVAIMRDAKELADPNPMTQRAYEILIDRMLAANRPSPAGRGAE